MILVEAIIRPDRLERVTHALEEIGVVGMTATDVRGCGQQRGYPERYQGAEYPLRLVPKLKLEIVLPAGRAAEAVEAIQAAGRTGEVGDGKLFLHRVTAAQRIRTGERDYAAL